MLKRINTFLKETSGNVAMTTAIVLFPIMTAAGAALDYTSYIQLRSGVQNSADAAGLAAARHLEGDQELTEAILKEYAKNFFEANISDSIPSSAYTFDLKLVPGDQSVEPPIADQIEIKASIEYDTIFGDLFFEDTIEEDIISMISLGNRTVEIALVLDNSGSMGGSRIATLKTEAKNLVDTVFNSASLTTIEDPVKFSLVPFSATVNVGSDNSNKNWIDKKGWSPVHHENLDWNNTYRTNNDTRERTRDGLKFGFQEKINGSWKWKTRFDVFDMLGTEWGGCVEMRPWPHNVMDTYVRINQGYKKVRDAIDADGDGVNDGTSALFVPYFAPDEPDRIYAASPGENYWDDDGYRNDYLYDFHDYDPSNPNTPIQRYTDNNASDPMFGKDWSDRQIERTNAIFKYQSNNQYNGNLSTSRGPNDGCKSKAITPLSTDRDDVKNKLDEMVATGTTNIQQGLTWGWRTVSPGEPFTEGRENDDKRNIKFIVLLTDGNNYMPTDGDSTPNESEYGAWGYARDDEDDDNLKNVFNGLPTHNRMVEGLETNDLVGTIYTTTAFDMTPDSSGDFEKIMNAHTNQACNNIKADGVSIFSIAFSVPAQGGVRDLMEACAGSGIKDGKEIDPGAVYYYDVDQGGLAAAFSNIARQIANLRISG